MGKKIVVNFVPLLLLASVSVFGTPPHPSNTNPTGREIQDANRPAVPLYMSIMQAQEKAAKSKAKVSPFAAKGNMRVLVLLVNFADTSMDTASNTAFYRNMLETGSGLTMRKYYQDMSHNQLNLTFDVEGPYTVSKNLVYYGQNDSSGQDSHPGELVKEALQKFIAEKGPGCDYAQYDNNRDGYADMVFVIHAGQGEEVLGVSPNAIWSHQWNLKSSGAGDVQAGDIKFNVYTIEPEYITTQTPNDSSIGVFCHEFGHVLGLPDLYDTTYTTNGVGAWSLMGSGNWGAGGTGKDPAPLFAWERDFVGGGQWIELAPLTSSAENVSFAGTTLPISSGGDSGPRWLVPLAVAALAVFFFARKTGFRLSPVFPAAGAVLCVFVFACSLSGGDEEVLPAEAFTISLNSPGQYLILEARNEVTDGSGPFVPGSGILITQIHMGVMESQIFANRVTAGQNSVHGITVIEANTIHDASGRGILWTASSISLSNYRNMLFSAETRTALTGNGKPNSNYYMSTTNVASKTGISGVRIQNISSTSFPMKFDLYINR